MDFSLINEGEPVMVAYSGGKDSLLLCHILKKLGYDVRAFIVDIGYNADWTRAIENINNLNQNIPCIVVDMQYIKSNIPEIVPEVEKYFSIVKEVSAKQGKIATTICTPCYNAKYIVLKALSEKLSIKKVAFGHHGTDAVTSLLKSYFMYEDRWTMNHETFKLSNIYDLIDSNSTKFSDDVIFENEIVPKLITLANHGKISTNEAPLEVKKGLNIIRPFFYCREEEIFSEIQEKNIVPVNSECSFIYRKNLVETSREYIQFHLVNKYVSDKNFQTLIKIIKDSLNLDGSTKFDTRKNRDKILGVTYKNDGICSEKL